MSRLHHSRYPFTAMRQDDPSGEFWWDIWGADSHSVAHVAEGARPNEARATIRGDVTLFTFAPEMLAVLRDVAETHTSKAWGDVSRRAAALIREMEEHRP